MYLVDSKKISMRRLMEIWMFQTVTLFGGEVKVGILPPLLSAGWF